MGTPRKINAILLNIKINRPKLVTMCRYKLATYWQNFTQIYLTRVKILQEVLGGLLFLTHNVLVMYTLCLKKSSPFLLLLFPGQILTNFNNVW